MFALIHMIYQFHPDDLTTPIAEFPTPLSVVQHLGAGLTVKLVERHLLYNKPKKLCGYVFSRTIATKPVPKQMPEVQNIPIPDTDFIVACDPSNNNTTVFKKEGDIFIDMSIQISEAAGIHAERDVPRGTSDDTTAEPADQSCYQDDIAQSSDEVAVSLFIPASVLLAAEARNKRKKP